MRLNDIKCTGHFAEGERLCFELDCEWSEAAALDGQTLALTEDGDKVEEHFGYKLTEIRESADATLFCWFDRALDDASKEAIESLEESVNALHGNVAEANATAASAEQTAASAMETAAKAGTDPQVKAVARLSVASIDFASVTATDVAAIPDYIPAWEDCIGEALKQNDPVSYEGTIYRCSQDVTVQEQYDPVTAGESQYYPIDVAEDGVIVYRECHGQYDMVRKGEKRHYPDADGPVYTALEDTAYSPDAYPQHWQLDEGQEGAEPEEAEDEAETEAEAGGEAE